MDHRLVVTEYELFVWEGVVELLQERAEPVGLTGTVEEADVLGFHGGMRDTALPLGGPANCAAAEEEDIS